MTQEEKSLLLQDLCARLPYGVIVIVNGNNERVDEINPFEGIITCGFQSFDVEECKPYLRPMSSMTEEEKKEFDKVLNSCNDRVFLCPEKERRYKFFDAEQEDFMNAHHFDYRGLIDKSLALKAPEGMYK